jgi:hypothetical protein
LSFYEREGPKSDPPLNGVTQSRSFHSQRRALHSYWNEGGRENVETAFTYLCDQYFFKTEV